MLLPALLTVAFASEAERLLHSQLFQAERYNPRVINSWRKVNRNDYASIRAFAMDKCSGYEPQEDVRGELGSIGLIDVFTTEDPYRSNQNKTSNFYCSGNKTIHIRLDENRGFKLENGYDFLNVEWESYSKQFTGGIDNLDPRLKKVKWYNLNQNWLKLQFISDDSFSEKGFKFEIKCHNEDKKTEVKNQLNFTIDDQSDFQWSKEISCINPHETVSYQLLTNVQSAFNDTVVMNLDSGHYQAVLSTNSSSEWTDSNSNKLLAKYSPVNLTNSVTMLTRCKVKGLYSELEFFYLYQRCFS